MEHNEKYKVLVLCKPQLCKRGLFPTVSQKDNYDEVKAITDFIACADETADLFDISNRIDVSVKDLKSVIKKLLDNSLNRGDRIMKEYIEMYDYPKYMNIEKGDIVFISSDTKLMLYDAMRNGKPVVSQ